jgi:hypothetical protein
MELKEIAETVINFVNNLNGDGMSVVTLALVSLTFMASVLPLVREYTRYKESNQKGFIKYYFKGLSK